MQQTKHLFHLHKADGNIFTVKAKTQPISIKGFDINMVHAPNPATVEIYFSPGIDPGKKTSAFPYQKIYNGTIFGQGKNNVTSLPELVSPVVIPAGASYSFYITVAKFSLGYMQCTKVSSVGGVSASNEFVEVLDGYSMGHPFLYYNTGQRWNGEKRMIESDSVLSIRIVKLTFLVVVVFCR